MNLERQIEWTIETFNKDSVEEIVESALDIEYLIGIDKKIREIHLSLALGGPNIYLILDGTSNASLEGYWGDESITQIVENEKFEDLFYYLEENFNN